MKGQALGYGAILVILVIGAAIMIYVTQTGESEQTIATGEGRLITFENYNALLLRTFDQGIEFISQRAAYDLGKNGGLYRSGAFWSFYFPTIKNLETELEDAIENNLPSSVMKDIDKEVDWSKGDINVIGYDEAPCGLLIENSVCFFVNGTKKLSVYDKSTDSRASFDHRIYSQIQSSYFKLLDAGREIIENPAYNSKLIDPIGLGLETDLETDFPDLDFTINTHYDPLSCNCFMVDFCSDIGMVSCIGCNLLGPCLDPGLGSPQRRCCAFSIPESVIDILIEDKSCCNPPYDNPPSCPELYCLAPLKSGETGISVADSPVLYDYLKLNFSIDTSQLGILEVHAWLGAVELVGANGADILIVSEHFHWDGDINWDGYINDDDLNLISAAFGSIPGDPNWDPDCDLNHDNKVDMMDVVIPALNYDSEAPSYRTQFNIYLSPENYKLIAKYNPGTGEITKEEMVTIVEGETTIRDFIFP